MSGFVVLVVYDHSDFTKVFSFSNSCTRIVYPSLYLCTYLYIYIYSCVCIYSNLHLNDDMHIHIRIYRCVQQEREELILFLTIQETVYKKCMCGCVHICIETCISLMSACLPACPSVSVCT